ncbi:MAG: SIMPL domain-containing protein [Bacteroidales bacterium]|nr:SIMPL domain-containing protein [Bacteroidales bacterium]
MAAENGSCKARVWSGLFVMIGLIVLGAMIPTAVAKLKSYDRTVTVKGLCEREVQADKVIWPLVIRVAGNDFASVYKEMERQNSIIRSFLKDGGIQDAEISLSSIDVSDSRTDTYNNDRAMRYIIKSVMTVCSANVDKVRDLIANQNKLIEKGVLLVNDWNTEIRYSYESLNDIKPAMVEEATKNARAVGQKFAQDSRSRLGKIKTASQGTFSISDRDSNTPWIKTVRVVNVVTYYIVD